MKLRPKNWTTFQHYKDRRPPWIKLHRTILDDKDFFRLPVASRALAPCLWLLASESEDGWFDGDSDEISFRLRLPEKEIKEGLKPLIEKGFFDCDSKPLAEGLHGATSETEEEVENRDREQRQRAERASARKATQMPEDFGPKLSHSELAQELGLALHSEFIAFSDFHKSKGNTFKDWDAALRTWLRNAKKFAPASRTHAEPVRTWRPTD